MSFRSKSRPKFPFSASEFHLLALDFHFFFSQPDLSLNFLSGCQCCQHIFAIFIEIFSLLGLLRYLLAAARRRLASYPVSLHLWVYSWKLAWRHKGTIVSQARIQSMLPVISRFRINPLFCVRMSGRRLRYQLLDFLPISTLETARQGHNCRGCCLKCFETWHRNPCIFVMIDERNPNDIRSVSLIYLSLKITGLLYALT